MARLGKPTWRRGHTAGGVFSARLGLSPSQQARQPKVGQLDLVALTEQDVVGLDVPVQDSPPPGMSEGFSCSHLETIAGEEIVPEVSQRICELANPSPYGLLFDSIVRLLQLLYSIKQRPS